jgi:thiol-disulfide isomerase/thioredoxin
MNLKATLILWLCIGLQAGAQTGYRIKATIRPFKSGNLYLAYHYGTKQYLLDSATLNDKSEAVFLGKEKLAGGVYMIVFPQKNNWIECIVDQQQQFEVLADTTNLFGSIRFTGSSDNTLFAEYQQQSYQLGTEISALQKKLTGASPAEAGEVRKSIDAKSRAMQDYREQFLTKHPKHLLSAIFRTLREPVVPPANQHPGGRYDSMYAYQYYKQHYWDGVSFADDRLVRTPVFQPKFDRYFTQVLPQQPDSLKAAADEILKAAETAPEMFKFVLSNLTDKYVNPSYMGQDAVFVHLFEKYYLTGKAESWMNDKYRKFIYDRGYSLMGNVLGARGADIAFLDTAGKKTSLYAINARYLVICFWDPTCSHCKEDVPKLDSLYQKFWKAQGVTLVGMKTEGTRDQWLGFIQLHNLKDWVHVYQTPEMRDADYNAGRPTYRQLYDVYQTPMLYLLDQDKRIIAKKLSYQQLHDLLQAKWAGTATN